AQNGFSNLPEFSGSGDGVLGAECTGASPSSGSTRIPAQVVTQLRTDLTHLRIFNHLGVPITGDVRVNCTPTVEVPAPQTVAKVRELARQTARQGQPASLRRRRPSVRSRPPAPPRPPRRGRYRGAADPKTPRPLR